MDFALKVKVNIKLSFPPSKNSLNPVKLTVQVCTTRHNNIAPLLSFSTHCAESGYWVVTGCLRIVYALSWWKIFL